MHKVSPELLESAIKTVKETLESIAEANEKGVFTTGWGEYSTLKLEDI